MLPEQAKMENAQDVEYQEQVEKQIVEELNRLPKEQALMIIDRAIALIHGFDSQ